MLGLKFLTKERGMGLSVERALGLGGLSATSKPLFSSAWPFFLFSALFALGLNLKMRKKEKMEYNCFPSSLWFCQVPPYPDFAHKQNPYH